MFFRTVGKRLSSVVGVASRPAGATLAQLYGVSCVCGVGFTMSLFIGDLAFSGGKEVDQVRIGVLAGSLIATIIGVALLYGSRRSVSV